MVAAGSRIVEGGGVAIPAHGLAEHVMLVLPELSPRASMTAPALGYEDPLRMLCKMPQMLGAEDVNVLASDERRRPYNPRVAIVASPGL